MAVYNPPEGYLYDDNTGLYYSQVVTQDAAGNINQVVTWFDANTGEYSRNIYPVKQKVNTDNSSKKNEKNERTEKISSMIREKADSAQMKELKDKAKMQSAKAKKHGRELGSKAMAYADVAGKNIRKEASSVNETIKANAKANAKEAGMAYTYVNVNLEAGEPNFMWKAFFTVKEYMNNSPLWLKVAICLVVSILDIIRITIVGFDNESSAPVFMMLAFVAIPFGIMDFIDLKRKYGLPLKQLQPSFALIICGSLMIAPAFYGNAILVRTFTKIWAMKGPIPIIIWYVMAVAAFAIMTFAISRKFKKYNIPKIELMMTVTVMTLLSFFVGILTLWAILIAVMIAIVLFFVPMLFQAGTSSGSSYSVTSREEHVEGYDYFGNKVYDSRYDDPL